MGEQKDYQQFNPTGIIMATNTILTLAAITRKSLQLFKNSNAFLQTIDRQYDSSFAVSGAKTGASLKVRLPNDYIVRSGATATAQDTTEKNMTITVASQKGVDVSFSSSELALSMDDFSDRILAPMVNVLAGGVATDVMTLAEGVPNICHAVDGSNNTISPTAATWLQAGAILDQLGAPRGSRKAVIDVQTQARVVAGFTGLFNPSNDTSDRWKSGLMGTRALGIDDWRADQTCILHTTGAYGTLANVSAVSASGLVLTTAALNGPLKAGDVVTVAGFHSVNRVTKASTGQLAQFVVTANANTSATSVNIYPPFLAPTTTGTPVPYQTVYEQFAGTPALASPIVASEQIRKNLVFCKEAFALVTADLELPTGAVVSAARENYDGISLRMIRDYNSTTDVFLTRLDILYGYASPRAEWCVIIADSV